MLFFVQFLVMGLGVGLLGTLVGAGGGFILTPLLLLIFTDQPSETIAATSLSVVCLNALSGSIAYYRQKRIDMKTSVSFALAGSVGAVIGVFTTSEVARGPFDFLLGLALLVLCISLINPPPPLEATRSGSGGLAHRRIVDSQGKVYEYAFRFRLGAFLSSIVGFLATFLGIGGGPMHVPLMIRILRIPPHIATATSQCELLFTTALAVAVHFILGNLYAMKSIVLPLAIGIIVGAQAGASISHKVKSITLTRILVVLMTLVSLQLLYKGASEWFW